MKRLDGFIMGILFVALVAIMAFATLMGITETMRWRAQKRLLKMLRDRNIPVSPIYLKRQLDRLNIFDLKKLDDWTTAIEKRDMQTAIAMWPDVMSVLRKTDLGLIFGGLGTLVGMIHG